MKSEYINPHQRIFFLYLQAINNLLKGKTPFLSAAFLLTLPGLVPTARAAPPQAVCNIVEFGAIGDGRTLNTQAIQKAIDACSRKGGGIVKVPMGHFMSGTILLKDNVTLYLDDQAELTGSLNPLDYRNVDPFKDGLGAEVGFAMVAAVDAKNVGIAGRGTINGQGKEMANGMPFKGEGWGGRPFLVRFVRCINVSLSDVQLLYAAAWTTNFFQCREVTIERLKIISYGVPHNDGIDVDSCQDVKIKDCDIESGDDAICFKTTSSMPTKNVRVSGCRLKSNQGAIKFGTESVADFENFKINNCQIRDTKNGGLKLLSADGANLKNITISDITMDNVATPIFIRLGGRLKTFRPEDKKGQVGTISNVVIKNVQARAAGKAQIMPPSGIFITGIPAHPVGQLTLENIEIELSGGGEREHGRQILPENIDGYPEINRFGPRLPAFGLYARHVKGLKIKGVTIKLGTADLRPAVICQDCTDLDLIDWKLPANAEAESLVRFESTRRAQLSGFELFGSPNIFLRVEGKESGQIRFKHNKLGTTKKIVDFGEDVESTAITR